MKKVIRKRDLVFGFIILGVNFLVIPRLPCVVKLVVAAPLFVNPWPVVIPPMGIKLVIPPITSDVTLTVTTQELESDSAAPDSENDVELGVAVTVPPGHVVLALGVDEIRIPLAAAPDDPSVVK